LPLLYPLHIRDLLKIASGLNSSFSKLGNVELPKNRGSAEWKSLKLIFKKRELSFVIHPFLKELAPYLEVGFDISFTLVNSAR